MQDKVIKILYIHHSGGWGGAASCLINLIKNLDRTKYYPEVLLLKQSEIAEKLAENNISYSVSGFKFYNKYYHFFAHSEAGYIKWYQIYKLIIEGLSWILSRYFYAKRELSLHDFDIIHLNSSVLTDWLAPAKKRGKVVIHVREPFRKGIMDLFHHIFKTIIRKNADQVIAISEDNAKRLDIREKTCVIYDFCEITQKMPSESSYGSGHVLYLGGSSTSKGFYTMAEVLDFLDKDVKVYFGGKYVITKNPQNLLSLIKFNFSRAKRRNAAIKKINDHPNAIMLGLIYNVEVYLDEVCCLVSPFSVPHFSFPVVEANCHLKPAIGSDVEGMNEIIDHETTGLIVEKNNPMALANAINSMTADSRKAKRLGEAGYIRALERFSPGNIKSVERLYDNLLFDDKQTSGVAL